MRYPISVRFYGGPLRVGWLDVYTLRVGEPWVAPPGETWIVNIYIRMEEAEPRAIGEESGW
ncbi:MAG: hypothetical protein KatS3mg109_0410 [Pirellulaceae bacterium]|nr:MAG: hypothetical protein KatS3mg109_0410 [Pirellulaceae bacterium]